MKNPQKVFVDVGLGFFVELTHDEAIAFIEKKTKLLDKKTDKLTQASTKIKANIKLVLHGLRELQGMPPVQKHFFFFFFAFYSFVFMRSFLNFDFTSSENTGA